MKNLTFTLWFIVSSIALHAQQVVAISNLNMLSEVSTESEIVHNIPKGTSLVFPPSKIYKHA